MNNYIITKDIDLSEEFEELSTKTQKEFLVHKFKGFSTDYQEEMIEDILGSMPDYSIVKVMQSAFDNLSSKYQAEMIEYIEDSNIV